MVNKAEEKSGIFVTNRRLKTEMKRYQNCFHLPPYIPYNQTTAKAFSSKVGTDEPLFDY